LNRKLNQTFVIVTHDRHQFGEVDKIITIKDGKIVEGELEASVA
jgi:lipoprotein-releasing system ATP-binding protein